MILASVVVTFLIIFVVMESKIYLYNTNDGLAIEYYDCVFVSPFFYCRRPREPTNLIRENDTLSCQRNGGQVHRFSELHSKNINISTVLHQWKSSIERVEQYSRYLNSFSESDGHLCQCIRQLSFGKNCEYRLPMGDTFQQTLDWQLTMRMNAPWEVQMHGDIVCYESLLCDSGLLCLDWREICDGVQQCMSGVDERHCGTLTMNICHNDEYRCTNGMCIPEQYFLDGEFDCLDRSDELQYKKDDNCTNEAVSITCDDRICPPHQWSCGDGQCIDDRLAFQKPTRSSTCQSRRDLYFLCETHHTHIMWTMANGRCYGPDRKYNGSLVENRTIEEQCEYLLRCALSEGGERGCSCWNEPSCAHILEEACPLSSIQYPRGAIAAPYLFFFYNLTRDWTRYFPDFILINGTLQCRDSPITRTRWLSVDMDLSERELTNCEFCSQTFNLSLSEPCDVNRSHRFRCFSEQETCLGVAALGDWSDDCSNQFDELWLGNRSAFGRNKL